MVVPKHFMCSHDKRAHSQGALPWGRKMRMGSSSSRLSALPLGRAGVLLGVLVRLRTTSGEFIDEHAPLLGFLERAGGAAESSERNALKRGELDKAEAADGGLAGRQADPVAHCASRHAKTAPRPLCIAARLQ